MTHLSKSIWHPINQLYTKYIFYSTAPKVFLIFEDRLRTKIDHKFYSRLAVLEFLHSQMSITELAPKEVVCTKYLRFNLQELPARIASGPEREVLALVCRVHELEADKLALQGERAARTHELRRRDLALQRRDVQRRLSDEIITRQRRALEGMCLINILFIRPTSVCLFSRSILDGFLFT